MYPAVVQVINPNSPYRIKRPKTHRYPSLKGTDPKFRRNHRHSLHGTMKALVWTKQCGQLGEVKLTIFAERSEGGQEGVRINTIIKSK